MGTTPHRSPARQAGSPYQRPAPGNTAFFTGMVLTALLSGSHLRSRRRGSPLPGGSPAEPQSFSTTSFSLTRSTALVA